MDIADEDFREPTEDVVSARRALALAIELINARRPLSTTEIRRNFYPGFTDANFRKSFLRDRAKLAATGLAMVKSGTLDNVATWTVDEEASFVSENELTPEDGLLLDCLLLPVAQDPTFPYARDLRLALAKIDRSFDGSSSVRLSPEARQRNNKLTRIEDCMTRRHALRMSYTRADGSTLTRTVLPYGLFPLRGTTYLVAANVDDEQEAPHTYNLDRVSKVSEVTRQTFEVPADFDVRDFVKLPFQLGTPRYVATFAVPAKRQDDVRHAVGVQGTWSVDATTLTTEVHDERIAAAWAIAQGVRPVSPSSLVQTWSSQLNRVVGGEQ